MRRAPGRAAPAIAAIVVSLAVLAAGQATIPDDPYFASRGAWGQPHADQWALLKIGFTAKGTGRSAWDVETGQGKPVIVAVLDTGLDYHHPDLDRAAIWRNPSPAKAGDPGGIGGDVIGWNFVDGSDNPWDDDGHGTFVAGLIAARANNGEGIAGINWGAQIMPLKVMNFVGRGIGFNVARAIVYAADHGARIINLSTEADRLTEHEQLAADYAWQKGALVVVAAGNQGKSTADRGPAALKHVLAVAATGPDDKRAPFSNWGPHVKLAAPGVDILSLRARGTDFMLLSGAPNYTAGASFVGPDAKYARASGTSFAAPLVSAVASLIWARQPGVTNVQVERMLLESADDIEVPGWDNFTGAGRLNALAALKADPDYHLTAKVARVVSARAGGQAVVQVFGTATGSRLERYEIQLGQGADPGRWKTVVTERGRAIEDNLLGAVPVREITAKGHWTVRLLVHDGRKTKEARGTLNVQ